MTPEEKAKAYDEALKVIKDNLDALNKIAETGAKIVNIQPIKNCFCRAFPELKESDDEKIRKWIRKDLESKYVVNNIVNNVMADKALAWLEKQGDKDELIKELGEYKAKYTQEVLEKHIDNMNNKDDERLRNTTIAFLKDFADKGYENAIECIDWLEKQGEQKSQGKSALEAINEEKNDNQFCVKSTNNVEPKFKVDDIIINIYYRWNGKHRIREITDGKYIFDSGSYINIKEQDSWELANKVEPKFHEGQWIVWQDKYYKVNYNGCGYELIDQNGASKSLEYGTIDETAHHWGVSDAKDGDVLIDTNEKFPFIFKQLKPCDIKTVIKNPLAVLGYCGIGGAGFTKGEGWGDTANCTYYPATKEQRDTLMKTMANAGYTFDFEKKELKKIENETEIPFSSKDSELIEESYYIPKGFHAEIDDDKVVIKKGEKPTWSEEDEVMLDAVISDIRFTQKAHNHEVNQVVYEREIDWLKFLKDRVGCEANCTTTKEWKPSDEQMDALQYVYRNLNPPLSEKLGWNSLKTLELMLEQLKNMKG